MVRVRAGIGYALTEAMDEGHCGLPEEELGPLAAKLLEVPDDLIRTALELELAEGTVVADTVGEIPCIFLGGLHRAERAIAGRLLGIAAGKPPWPHIDQEKALPWGRAARPGSPWRPARPMRYARHSPRRSPSSPADRASARRRSSTRSCASCPPRASISCCVRRPAARPSG